MATKCEQAQAGKSLRSGIQQVVSLAGAAYGAYWYHDRKKKRKEDPKWYGYAWAFLTLGGLAGAVASLGTDLPFVGEDVDCNLIPETTAMMKMGSASKPNELKPGTAQPSLPNTDTPRIMAPMPDAAPANA